MQATDPVLFDLIIIAVSILSGCFGAMLGLGGGVILIPVLVSVLGVDVKSAIAASLVAVVTTSGAAALIRGRDSMSNYRVGVTLEVAAGLGAIAGAMLATIAPGDLLTMLFGLSLLLTAALSWRGFIDAETVLPQSWWGRVLQLDNYRKLTGFGWPGFTKMNLWRQDKGQKACAAAFLQAVAKGTSAPIPFDQVIEVSRISIEIAEAAR